MMSPSELREIARRLDGQYLVVHPAGEMESFADAVDEWATDFVQAEAEAPGTFTAGRPTYPADDTYTAGVIADALRAAADYAEILAACA